MVNFDGLHMYIYLIYIRFHNQWSYNNERIFKPYQIIL